MVHLVPPVVHSSSDGHSGLLAGTGTSTDRDTLAPWKRCRPASQPHPCSIAYSSSPPVLRSSPLSLRRFLWSKFWTALPPLLVLSQILTLASNQFLGASRFMTILASVTISFVCFGIVGMGVGMGAMFPRFRFENITQIARSSGGLLYMMATTSFIALVLFLEALPVYFYLSAQYRGEPLDVPLLVALLAVGAVGLLNLMAVVLPIRWGERRLAALEL